MKTAFVNFARSLVCGALLWTVGGVHAEEHKAGSHHGHAPLRGVQSLDVCAEGERLHLLLGEYREGEKTPALLYRRSEDGGASWAEPVRVDTGLPAAHAARRGMDAQIAGAGDQLVAVWMTRGTGMFDSGPMVTARSQDGGKTWQPGPNPADDASTAGHGFIDIAADAAGAFHLTWLDDRNGHRGLRYARSADAGKSWSANMTVDAETCECCWNAMAVGEDGSVGILYRDKAPRDMSVALLGKDEKQWRANRAGEFGWDFNGCPHVGGGIVMGGSVLHATVWTGLQPHAGVYYLRSPDKGSTWSKPQPLRIGSASHPDIATDKTNSVIAAWDQPGEGISVSESGDGGVTWASPARVVNAAASASHPRVVITKRGVRVFWTEVGEDGVGQWRSALQAR
jgi:hypothetical protein